MPTLGGPIVNGQDVRALPRATSEFFGAVAIVCFAYVTLALAALHVLRPDRPLTSSMISSYAVGPYGWVMTSCFLVWGVGYWMLLIGLIRAGLRSALSRLGAALFGVWSLCCVISASFPMDLADAPRTRAGEVHTLSLYIGAPSFVVATFLLSLGFKREARWRTY
jgi:Protein of unknown function (DUF998)